MPDAFSNARPIVRPAILFEASLILLAAVLDRLLGTGIISLLQPSWTLAVLGIAVAGPPLIFLWWSLRTEMPTFAKLRAAVHGRVLPLFRGARMPEVIALAAAAGVGEELLFRGVLQSLIGGWVGTVGGVLITATLFGLMHYLTRAYAVLAGLVGAYLGGVVVVTGSVIPAMVAHGVYDWAALLLLMRDQRASQSNTRDEATDDGADD